MGKHLLSLPPRANRWRSDVVETFTVFGRLVYIGSLLDTRSRAFVHQGLELRFGKQGARELICDAYSRTLEVWLGYDRARQEKEIRDHFAALEAGLFVADRTADDNGRADSERRAPEAGSPRCNID